MKSIADECFKQLTDEKVGRVTCHIGATKRVYTSLTEAVGELYLIGFEQVDYFHAKGTDHPWLLLELPIEDEK